MKRDSDLVRSILLWLEQLPKVKADAKDISIDGYSTEIVKYHLELARQVGLIEVPSHEAHLAPSLSPMTAEESVRPKKTLVVRNFDWSGIALSWQGHEFLDASRSEDRWKKAKDIANRGGGVSFDVLKSILVSLGQAYVKQQLGL